MTWTLKIYDDNAGREPSTRIEGTTLLELFHAATALYANEISPGCQSVEAAMQDNAVCAWCGKPDPTVTLTHARLHPECVTDHLTAIAETL